MGNLNGENICNCENNDSNIETSFKNNPSSDKYLCPFIKTIIYQNYNIDNGRKSKNISNKKRNQKLIIIKTIISQNLILIIMK